MRSTPLQGSALLALWLCVSLAPAAGAVVSEPARALAPGGLFGDGGLGAEDAPVNAARPVESLALPVADPGSALAFGGLTRKKPKEGEKAHDFSPLTAERAQVLLRSLTVPGWGEATLDHDRSATVFGLAELGVWSAFTAFRVQVQLRREATERTARLLAGIDLDGRNEEFRRVIGSFISSDEYNQLVVYRDAANLHYDDPAAYRQYIAEHSLKGADTWQWDSEESLLRYRAQRRNVTQAAQRANTVLAVAIVNRLLSALHVARIAHHPQAGDRSPRSWKIEMSPSDPNDASAYRLGVHTRF